MLPGKLNDLTRAIDMLRGIVQSIAKGPVVQSTGRLFSFTGHARTGGRKVLGPGLGEATKPTVTPDLHFLAVGALSQPCWVYSSYGRKIERAIENKKRGAPTQIIHENDFIRAAANV